jgi:hypothetical protein
VVGVTVLVAVWVLVLRQVIWRVIRIADTLYLVHVAVLDLML